MCADTEINFIKRCFTAGTLDDGHLYTGIHKIKELKKK